MERVEYLTDGNTIGISIKYPAEIRRKWSEKFEDVQCECCGSTDISSAKQVDRLVIACHECANYWIGSVDRVLTWYGTEEARVSLFKPTFEKAD